MTSNALRVWVIAAGVVLGVAYALSPLTVWFVAIMAGLVAVAGRGLPDEERRAVWIILSVAVALRLLALAALFLGSDHNGVVSFFWDGDGKYLKVRAIWIRDLWLGVPIDSVTVSAAFTRSYGWTTYLYVIAYVQYLVGLAPYGIHLFNVALFMATAILLYRIARFAYGSQTALLGFAILLFLPTPFMWSISALKESLYVFLQVCAIAAIVLLQWKGFAVKWVARAILAIVAVWLNRHVREGALQISTLGLALGLVGSFVTRIRWLAILALVCLPFVVYAALQNPDIQTRIMAQLKTRAVQHVGHVHTEGNSYKVLDQRFYSDPVQSTETIYSMTPVEGARFAVRAIAAFILVPLPWQVRSWPEMIFLPQQIAWYGLVVLGCFGFVDGLKRNAVVTCLFAAFAAAGGVAIALNSGNIGTMVRHRDTIVPFVVWLSALGAVDVIARLAAFGARSVQHGFVSETGAACH